MNAVEALVSLGSNVEPERNLPEAVRRLAELFALRAVSSAWSTQPVGPAGQPPFLNAAAVIATDASPTAVRERLRGVEAAMGRRRPADPFAPRPIDLDLLLYGELVLTEGAVRLPDPELAHQAFLAVPAAEVRPRWRHPTTGEALAVVAGRVVAALPEEARPRRAGIRLGG